MPNVNVCNEHWTADQVQSMQPEDFKAHLLNSAIKSNLGVYSIQETVNVLNNKISDEQRRNEERFLSLQQSVQTLTSVVVDLAKEVASIRKHRAGTSSPDKSTSLLDMVYKLLKLKCEYNLDLDSVLSDLEEQRRNKVVTSSQTSGCGTSIANEGLYDEGSAGPNSFMESSDSVPHSASIEEDIHSQSTSSGNENERFDSEITEEFECKPFIPVLGNVNDMEDQPLNDSEFTSHQQQLFQNIYGDAKSFGLTTSQNQASYLRTPDYSGYRKLSTRESILSQTSQPQKITATKLPRNLLHLMSAGELLEYKRQLKRVRNLRYRYKITGKEPDYSFDRFGSVVPMMDDQLAENRIDMDHSKPELKKVLLAKGYNIKIFEAKLMVIKQQKDFSKAVRELMTTLFTTEEMLGATVVGRNIGSKVLDTNKRDAIIAYVTEHYGVSRSSVTQVMSYKLRDYKLVPPPGNKEQHPTTISTSDDLFNQSMERV